MSAVLHPIALAGRRLRLRGSEMIMAGFLASRYTGLPPRGQVRRRTDSRWRALDVGDVMTSSRSTKSGALLLFAFVIVAWGLNWTVTKLIVTHVTPLWTTAIRT